MSLPEKPPSFWRLSESNNDIPEQTNGNNHNASVVSGTPDRSGRPPIGQIAKQGTLLGKWKEYADGQDEDEIINNIYTHKAAQGGDIIMGKQEKFLTEDSKILIKELRLKAAARHQCELDATPMATRHTQVMRSELAPEGTGGGGGTFYLIPQTQSIKEVDSSDDEDAPKRKEPWYKKAHRLLKPKPDYY